MRRWLLIFLVVLLPMQLSWAAVASYCQHESGNATTQQHVGHHEHQHTADHADTSKSSHPSATGAVDVDCGTCHAGCCSAMVPSLSLLAVQLPTTIHSAPALRLSSHPASLPERPNWADLA